LHTGGREKWGEIYTSLLALQVCFNHLLLLQGDNLQKLFSFNTHICRHTTLIGKLQQQQQAQKLEGWGEGEMRWVSRQTDIF